MTNLKRSFLGVVFYVAVVFVLGQFDFSDSPIIDFAKYFYFLVMIAVPVTVFFPSISRVSVLVPIIVWASVYFVLLQVLDRSVSAPNSTFPIVLLEFVLVVIGVWLAYQLADGISHAESVMDAMAIGAFPNRSQNFDEASKQIKIEITRSRRYHRPLSMLALQIRPSDHVEAESMIFSVQHDLFNRFSLARIGQIVDENIRQTDILFRDRSYRFFVLSHETDCQNSLTLGKRIYDAISARTGIQIAWSAVAFPDDALNFDDLMDVARSRLVLHLDASEERQEAIHA